MKPQDVPIFSEAEFGRTVKLLAGDPGTPLDSLVDKPWCVAPGLVYAICKFDRALSEAFKEETGCPDSAIKRYVLNWPMFDIPGTEFSRLSSGREIISLETEALFESFKDFCCSIKISDKKSNKTWTIGAATTTYPDRGNPMAANVSVDVLCPFDSEYVYYPFRKSIVDIGYTIIKTKYGSVEETGQ